MAAVAAPPGRGGNAPSVWAKRWRFGSCGQWVWRRHPAVAGRENCCDESIEKACERNAQPHRVPLIRPAGTFSPSGGEGMHRTSRADEWFGLQPDDLFYRAAGKPALRRSRSGSANRLLRTVSRCTRVYKVSNPNLELWRGTAKLSALCINFITRVTNFIARVSAWNPW